MSLPDPSRAYQNGVINVACSIATEALNSAFGASMAADGYDHPRTKAIREAQDAVARAWRDQVEWNPPRD